MINDKLHTEAQKMIVFTSKIHRWKLAKSLDVILDYAVKAARETDQYYDSMTELLYTVLPSFYLLDHEDQRKLIVGASENKTLCDFVGIRPAYQFEAKP
jgi:hypothetical protein